MAHVRRRANGRWQAIVSLPDGRQVTRTDPLKRVVQDWALAVEADLRRDRWHDPRRARALTVGEWRAAWDAARIVEQSTRQKDNAHWRTRVGPRWADTPLTGVTRQGVQAWVRVMVDGGAGAHTVAGAVRHLGAMLEAASRESLLPANPVHGVTLPATDAGRLRWFTRAEFAAICDVLEEPYRTLVDLGCHTGLRWGELSGLDARAVDLERRELHVRQVLTRAGLRPYAKSRRSHRTVPVPEHLVGPLAELADAGGLVFSGLRGGRLHEGNFRRRVWAPALAAAGVDYAPPHTMRHTAASWLVMAGVDLYRVQAILGHESFATTQLYAHLAPDAHGRVRDAWGALD